MSSIPAAELAYPALSPPPGVKPNFINPSSAGNILIVPSSILLVVMYMFVANRFYTKFFISRKFTWDDGTCLVATIFTTLYFAVVITAVTKGNVGVHQWDLTLAQYLIKPFLITSWLSSVLASPTLAFIKITFFILYLQLFRPSYKLRIAIWIGGVFTILFYIGYGIALFVLSTPRGGETWIAHIQSPAQAEAAHLSIPLPAVGLFIDIYILILPLIGIFNLHLSFRRKLEVSLVFLTAIMAVIASILSIVYRVPVTKYQLKADITGQLIPIYLTSIVEMTLGVSVSCMPAFSHMIHHNLSWYKTIHSYFRSRFQSQLSWSRRSHSKGTSDSHSGYQNISLPNTEQAAKYQGLVNVRTVSQPSESSEFELRYCGPVKTSINGGQSLRVDDGVHLKYELTQESHEDKQDSDNSPRGKTGPRANMGREMHGVDMV